MAQHKGDLLMVPRIIFLFIVASMITPPALALESAKELIASGGERLKEGDYQKAIADFERALKIDKKNVIAHLSLGLAYAHTGELDKAVKHGKKATELNPGYASFYNLGLIYAATKKADKALQAFDKALEASPGSYAAEYQKGLVYTSRKDYEEARAAHEHAIELNPHFADAYLALAGISYKLGLKDDALKQAETLRKIGRNDLAEGVEQWIKEQGG